MSLDQAIKSKIDFQTAKCPHCGVVNYSNYVYDSGEHQLKCGCALIKTTKHKTLDDAIIEFNFRVAELLKVELEDIKSKYVKDIETVKNQPTFQVRVRSIGYDTAQVDNKLAQGYKFVNATRLNDGTIEYILESPQQIKSSIDDADGDPWADIFKSYRDTLVSGESNSHNHDDEIITTANIDDGYLGKVF